MKTKQSAFTLIELIIVLAIVAILAAVVVPAFTAKSNADGSMCKYGMKYDRGNNRQIIGPNGGGIPCEVTDSKVTGVPQIGR